MPGESVPVKLESTWAGLAENSGLLRLEGDALVLEFETKDSVLQVLKSDSRHCRVPLSELESCCWKPGWFGGDIELAARNLSVLGGIPGAAQGRVVLHVGRRDRHAALALVSSVELAFAYRVLQAAEDASAASFRDRHA